MKLRRVLIGPFLLAFALLPGLCAASLHGLPAYGKEAYRYEYLRAQDGEISRKQAASKVKRRYGGKILSISETRRQGQAVYRVKGLSDKSQVYVVYVDKKSGRISR